MKCSILTMNKNEKLLLEPWIIYYGNLFSFNNICIVDNGSTDTDVLKVLDKYSEKGTKVIYYFNRPEDFSNKGTILKDLAQKFYSDSDFVFFLDVDEFIFLNTNNSFIYDKEPILKYLRSIPVDTEYIYNVNKMYYNIPLKYNLFTKCHDVNKVFFQGGTVKNLDIGFHTGECNNSNRQQPTSLGIIHFHNKLYYDKLSAAREKMKLRVDINDIEKIRNYVGLGAHLKGILLESEADYYIKFEDKIKDFITEPNFRLKLKEYGTRIKF
jgi:hypothetical protein